MTSASSKVIGPFDYPKSHKELFNALAFIDDFVGVAKEGRNYVVTTKTRKPDGTTSTMIHATHVRTLRQCNAGWWIRTVVGFSQLHRDEVRRGR